MKLLVEIGERGYPTEYLLSRIRGRRGVLRDDLQRSAGRDVVDEGLLYSFQSGAFPGIQGDGSWPRLLREYRWAYLQMNRGMRKIFTPFFTYFELKTLILCLRNRKSEAGSEEVESLLSQSLLSAGIKKQLTTGTDLGPVLEAIEEGFTSSSFRHPGLVRAYETNGLQGVEERLCVEFLEQTLRLPLSPAITEFFRSIVDRRNISLAFKHVRWGLTSDPSFVSGGTVRGAVLSRILDEKDISGITDMVRELSGEKIEEPTGPALEWAMKRALTKKIARLMRDDLQIGLILDYLWRRCIETENLNLMFYGRGISRDVIDRELVH